MRIARICSWLSDDFPQLNAVVEKLHELSEQNPARVTAYMLVAESAVNVLQSFTALRAAADRCFEAAGSGFHANAGPDTKPE